MAERTQIKEREEFQEIALTSKVEFFSTGSTLLNKALGGGWANPRVLNIVGDKSTGKTLLAIEGFANFSLKYAKVEYHMRYAEAESAFDDNFAKRLGFPPNVSRPKQQLDTIEDFEADLWNFLKKDGPKFYILDSLDALTDSAEKAKFIKGVEAKAKKAEAAEVDDDGESPTKEKGSYGMAKAKRMSELFRLMVRECDKRQCTVGVISQIRDRVDVSFGETKTRSGGHALDFYASQVLWLADMGKIKRTLRDVEHVIGVDIEGYVKKLKVGTPFKKARFPILFNYGVDDESSMIEYLKKYKEVTLDEAKKLKAELSIARNKGDREYILKNLTPLLQEKVEKVWNEIERELMPKTQKYSGGAVAQP